MKKNKYRWREMKDEKPDIEEKVLFLSKYEMGSYRIGGSPQYAIKSGFVWPCEDESSVYLTYGYSMEGRYQRKKDDLLWRKMCKLPGEK